MNNIEMAAHFNYYFLVEADHKNQPFFSLDPKESDLAINSKILNALIGTLVKYGNSGKIEPYLAEKIDISPDKLHWSFTLRKGLVCEDGTTITAHSFKDVFEQRLRTYAEKGSVLVFDHLVGWNQFLKGGRLEGIQAADNQTLNFSLVKEDTEFLEYLRMPYFGYWCPGNFENGGVRDEFSVISSAAYKISKKSEGRELELIARKEWFSISPESPQKILFSSITNASDFKPMPYSLIDLGLNSSEQIDDRAYQRVLGVPTILTTIVLNPHNGYFANNINRRKFAFEIFNNNFKPFSKNRIRSNFFFPHDENKMLNATFDNIKEDRVVEIKTLTFAVNTRLSDVDLDPLKDAIKKALPGISVEFVRPDKTISDWYELLLSNKHYSARISSVDAGGSFAKSPIKMMFCSNLGVRFPDPSGRICALTSEYERDDKEIDQKYVTTFNEALFEDAAVIPIYFSSESWLVGKNINMDSIPSSVMYFQYEKMRLQ